MCAQVDSKDSLCSNEKLHYKKGNENLYIYGNYHRYYGYRNKEGVDPRLVFMKHEWFTRKVVLDIGCNAGHLTLRLAKDFSPDVMIGIDIDPDLVVMAKRNVRSYLNFEDFPDDSFPLSNVLSFGPIAVQTVPKMKKENVVFPYNVAFVKGDYVLESDDLLQFEEQHFDTILCLSLTKWVHLNYGDSGLKRLFHRMFANLNPGGHVILEAQPQSSYHRTKKMTEDFTRTYNSIKLFPEMFNEYLLKEVGFSSCELIDIPAHSSKGFCRPMYLFTKAEECKPEIVFQDRYFDKHDESDDAKI